MRIGLSLKLSEPKYNVLAQNIQALFADGSQGWWYDDNDTTTLFQDSAGTTPVTAVEQFVGLQLDKSKGLVLGPELVTNGDGSGTPSVFGNPISFFQGTGAASGGTYNINATVVLSGCNARFVADASAIGKRYKIEFDVLVPATFDVFNVKQTINSVDTTVQTVTARGSVVRVSYISSAIQTASDRPLLIDYRNASNTTDTFKIDNISIRELPGNHRYAPASGNRPVWSKRVNLLTKTEQFDDAVWGKTNTTVTANAAIAPDGTTTADLLIANTTSGAHYVTNASTFGTAAACVFAIYVKPQGYSKFGIREQSTGSVEASFNLNGAGSVIGVTGATATATISALNDGWYRIAATSTLSGASSYRLYVLPGAYVSGALNTYSWAGDGTSGIFIWGADLRPANQATGLLPLYQRVNTSTDYATNGFPGYLKADGVDDFLQTNSINFTATDKITLCAGVRKLSDAATGVFAELSANWNSNNGSFFSSPNENLAGASTTFNASSRGTAVAASNQFAVSASTPSPVTVVWTFTHDIAGDLSAIRLNGAASGTDGTGDKGSGNFGNYPVYFFQRGGTSLPFNGYEYGNIAVGKLLTADQLTALETYMNDLTKAY